MSTDTSHIVKVCALQGLADLPALRHQTNAILEQAPSTGSPAGKRRGCKLLHYLTTQRRHEERKTT